MTPARAKPQQIPGAWAGKCGKGTHLWSPWTNRSGSDSGCMGQPYPRQGSNNQEYVQRKGIVEPTMRRNHFIFLTPGIYQDEGSGQKAELDIADMPVRPQIPRVAEQSRRLEASLWLWGPLGTRLVHSSWVSLGTGMECLFWARHCGRHFLLTLYNLGWY